MLVMWLQKLSYVVVKNLDSGVRPPGFTSQLYHHLAMNSQASYLNPSMLLFFPLHKIGLEVAAISGDFSEDQMNAQWQTLQTVSCHLLVFEF